MTTLRLILGDHLTRSISSLRDLDPDTDVILMVEVMEEATYVPHHKQKIAFILSAMRHFAAELVSEGLRVDYIRLDDPDNSGSFTGEVARAIARHQATRIIVTEPGEYRVLAAMKTWSDTFGCPVTLRSDNRFFASRKRFRTWTEGRKQWRMEFFYREMRQETGFLMDGDKPTGGQWNFDHDNRKRLPAGTTPPSRMRSQPDAVTREVLQLVAERFAHHFGDLEPFGWPVTRADALLALDHFINDCLGRYGDYQDAMKQGEPFLFHSLLSPLINVGLLTPQEVCAAAEGAYRQGKAPLNAVEGFIRQILGWREYVRGIYWAKMPDYAETNALDAQRPLPWFFWSGETPMNCISQTVGDIQRTGYGHHIQRLMVTGNFALLAGIRPAEIETWYLAVFVDAFDWVELPNVHGMVMHADGGLMASKPYAASGAYINRMSDYCGACHYRVQDKTGAQACPFNYLYWNFLIENEKTLARNPRLAMPYRTLAGFPASQRQAIVEDAKSFFDSLAVS